jgi:hypothetical protein
LKEICAIFFWQFSGRFSKTEKKKNKKNCYYKLKVRISVNGGVSEGGDLNNRYQRHGAKLASDYTITVIFNFYILTRKKSNRNDLFFFNFYQGFESSFSFFNTLPFSFQTILFSLCAR